jgi:8-amino-7-oxononanoate synthase
MKDLEHDLQQRRRQHRYRERRLLETAQGVEPVIDGRRMLSFCSNDYLGLADHPALKAAMHAAIDRYGAGSGAAHLVSGHTTEHHALEEELAAFFGRPRALLFSTGYMANIGVMSALLQRGDAVFEDRLNHASLLDGGLLSGARLHRYHHADSTDLAKRLQASSSENRLVVTDGVFSMDGDTAPLRELADVSRRHQAWLMVDDAHGIGVLGANGRGSLEQAGLGIDEVPVLMGTLGKALGSFGAFITGSEALIETLIQQARSYIYTTAPPAAVAAASRAALKLVESEAWRRERLQQNIGRFRQGAQQLGLALMASDSPVQPLLLGDDAAAVAQSRRLAEQDILVMPIRPPTVPEGTARLRITLCAEHSDAQIDRLLEALA